MAYKNDFGHFKAVSSLAGVMAVGAELSRILGTVVPTVTNGRQWIFIWPKRELDVEPVKIGIIGAGNISDSYLKGGGAIEAHQSRSDSGHPHGGRASQGASVRG